MPSSTSSSNDRLPPGPWGVILTAAMVTVIISLGGMECALRQQGFQPGIQDSAALWAMRRREVRPNNPLQVVMIGASRLQLGLDLEAFREEVPGSRPVQLAIDGSSPWPILQDLARQDSFTGVVVCSAGYFDILDPDKFERADEYLDFERKMTGADQAEQDLKMILQSRLALLLPEVNPQNALRSIIYLKWPDKPYIITRPDRSRQGDYSPPDVAARQRRVQERKILRQPRPKRPPPAQLLVEFERIEQAVKTIQGRGGRVVFVRLPSSGFVHDYEETIFPRRQYWDIWHEHTAAVMIHYQDYPKLSEFRCADYSHFDHTDAAPFTRSLARIIRAKLESEGRHFPVTPGE